MPDIRANDRDDESFYARNLKTLLSTDEKRRNGSFPCSHETSINFFMGAVEFLLYMLTGKLFFA